MPENFPWKVSADKSGLVFEEADEFLAAYLSQLEEEDYIVQDVLTWEKLYALVDDENHEDSLHLLRLPPSFDAKCELISRGSLNDPDFSISIASWTRFSGDSFSPALLARIGAVVRLRGASFLLPRPQYILLDAVAAFRRRSQNSFSYQQKEWAKIRKYAVEAGARLDRFLSQTIVLKPDTLHFTLEKRAGEGEYAGEIIPSFDDMPKGWLDIFDKTDSVQDSYSIAEENGGIVHVLVDEAVFETLKKVKALPGRRKLTRDDLLALKSDPHGFFGEASREIVSLDEIDREIDKAGFILWEHRLLVGLDRDRNIKSAEIYLTPLTDVAQPEEALIDIGVSRRLRSYCDNAIQAFDRKMPEFIWEGYILRIQDAQREVVENIMASVWGGRQAVQEDWLWQEISQYGKRVQGIGELIKVPSQFLLKSSKINWTGEQQVGTMQESGGGSDGNETQHNNLVDNVGDLATRTDGSESPPDGNHKAIKSGVNKEGDTASEDKPLSSAMEVLQPGLNIEADDYSRLFEKNGQDFPEPLLPSCLRKGISLLPHQKKGVAWLQKLIAERGSGCILADDMGLGKTLQLLSVIVRYFEDTPQEERFPVLVVAPVSLMENWYKEVDHFFQRPPMRLQMLHGEHLQDLRIREGNHNSLRDGWRTGDLVLTTYETLRSFQFPFARERWHCIICDEAQKIKNPNAMVTQAVKAVGAQADFCVACTGTPVENSLSDLWCLFDFSCPGFLGTLNHDFGPTYQRPIELKESGYEKKNIALKEKIEPYVLRRLKGSVAKDLPKKIEESPQIMMNGEQLAMCRAAIAEYRKTLAELKKQNSRINPALFLLHKLRGICANPFPEEMDVQAMLRKSPKMQWLKDKLTEISEKGEKAIVFTEFRAVQRSIKKMLTDCFGLSPVIINGDTNTAAGLYSRQGLIDKFQETEGFNVIILSTTAVGFGVNVQEANHVIHFTRSWNPAKEDQATDRAYRIGQKRDVYVYYPTMLDQAPYISFETNLNKLLAGKRELARDILATGKELKVEDFMDGID